MWRDVLLEMMPPAVKGLWTHQICTSKDRLGERGEGEGVRAPRIAAARTPPIATVGSVTSHQHVFLVPKIDMPQLETVSLTNYDPGLDAVTKGTGKGEPLSGTFSVIRSMVSQSCGTFYGRQ